MISDLPRLTLSKAILDKLGGQVWLVRRLPWNRCHLKGLIVWISGKEQRGHLSAMPKGIPVFFSF